MRQANIHIVYDRKKIATDGVESPIQIDVTKNGKRIFLATGIKITKQFWKGKEHQWVSNDHSHGTLFNKTINEQLQKLRNYDLQQFSKGINYPIQSLKRVLEAKPIDNFLNYFEDSYKTNPKIKDNTKKYFKSTLNHLQAFGKIIDFSDVNYYNISRFNDFLHAHKNKGENLKETTIAKYHKALKSIINKAKNEEYLDSSLNAYKDIKTNARSGEKVFLNEDEIKLLEKLKIDSDNWGLNIAKDIFLLCVYTGLRYSDIIKLNSKTIHFDDYGNIHISLISEKTGKPFRINLNDFFKTKGKQKSRPEVIILRYKEQLFANPFKISGQYYNRNLKAIAKLANIDKVLTSHVARHSFGTFMASRVNQFTLKELMQHSRIETTNIYVHLAGMDKEIKKIKW